MIVKRYLFLLLIFIYCMPVVFSKQKVDSFGQGKVVLLASGEMLIVEVASTEKQRYRGLMYRSSLSQNAGMLFIFNDEEIQRMWMKDTLFPLDIMFISSQNKVVSILKNLYPCMKKQCDIYSSGRKAKYMLEVNAGVVDANHIRIGESLLLPTSTPSHLY